ncbi:MAG: T9SS type A sorting domain-containing protein [Mucilaginibacter sp.]
MRQKFTYSYSFNFIIAAAIWMNFAFTINTPIAKADTNYFWLSKKSKKKNSLPFSLPPIKAGTISSVKLNITPPRSEDKLLYGVEVSPNPVTDQINLKYAITRNSSVSIKMTDILGNEVFAVTYSGVEPGPHSFPYAINNKFNKGFYFIRVVAGTESVIKRISIL